MVVCLQWIEFRSLGSITLCCPPGDLVLTFPEFLGLSGFRGPHSQQDNISSKEHSMYCTKVKATLPPRHFRIFGPRDQQARRGRDD